VKPKPFTTQQKAALEAKSHVFVEAGAGSGKTAVLVQRYVNLLSENTSWTPLNIVAITFTKKSAHEMKVRVKELLHTSSHFNDERKAQLRRLMDQAPILTIHGLCKWVLQRYALEAGLSATVTVFEEWEADKVWRQALDEVLQNPQSLKGSAWNDYLAYFSVESLKRDCTSLWQNRLHLPPLTQSMDFHSKTTQEALKATAVIYEVFDLSLKRYSALKQSLEAIDFDDLIEMTHTLLTQNKLVRDDISQDFKVFMVDEFQDTDVKQWEIIQALLGPETALFLVGDKQQSIYSFRGANSEVFESLKDEFKDQFYGSKTLSLSTNFRTVGPVLGFINTFFKQLFSFSALALDAHRESVDTQAVQVAFLEDESGEGFTLEMQWVFRWLMKNKVVLGFNWSDVALLFRRKKYMKTAAEYLEKQGIPVVLQQSQAEFTELDRNALLVLKALYNLSDTVTWLGVMNRCFNCDENTLLKLSQQEGDTVFHKLQHAEFLPCFERCNQAMALFLQGDVLEAVKLLVGDFSPWLQDIIQGEWRTLGMESLIEKLESFLVRGPSLNGAIAQEGIQLLSVHGAKGLEFKVVMVMEMGKTFYTAPSDPLIVHKEGAGLSFSIKKEQDNSIRQTVMAQLKAHTIEEEKRVFYVACTRAKDVLVMVGVQKPKVKKPSEETQANSWLDWVVDFLEKSQGQFHIPLYKHLDELPEGASLSSTTQQPSLFPSEEKLFVSLIPSSGHTLYTQSLTQWLTSHDSFASHPLATAAPFNADPLFGTLLHWVFRRLIELGFRNPQFEYKAWLEREMEPLFLRNKVKQQLRLEYAELLKNQVELFVKSDLFQCLMRATELFTERPFSMVLDAVILEGRIDVMFQENDQWIVLDYKSGQLHSRLHEPQMRHYAKALKTVFHVNQSRYKAIIFHTATGEQVMYEFAPEQLV